ncbi:MAG: hypothetical protein V4547_08995 [Bacteroidota bacterium]
MEQQSEFQFPTDSPINSDKLGGQNLRLYNYLLSGKTIHCFDPAKNELKIGYLNSRISDLVKHNVEVFKRYISVNDTTVKEYSLTKF